MIIHKGFEDLEIVKPVVTLGIFDGVHTGHRMLLDRLNRRASDTGGESVVVTFSAHPRMVLEKNKENLMLLSTPGEKNELLRAAGADHLVITDFNEEFSRIEACDFIRQYIVGKIGARYLIVGHDHRFGRSGTGDFETLKRCSGLMNFMIEKAEALTMENVTVSSTVIREALLDGRLDLANRLLGYDYFLSGKVISGRKIGRSIGYPTANISSDPDKLIPSDGVYAVVVILQGKEHMGMLSIGTNPTVSSGAGVRSIEVNLIDFQGDIYGERLKIVFCKRLRNERKFESIDKLTHQMSADREDTLNFFRNNK